MGDVDAVSGEGVNGPYLREEDCRGVGDGLRAGCSGSPDARVYFSARSPKEKERGLLLSDGTVRGYGPAVGIVLLVSGKLSSTYDGRTMTYL